MSLSGKLGGRFKFAFGAEIVSAVASALLTVLLARFLTPDSYGLLFLAISILTIGKLLSTWGIAKSASRYITEYKEKDPSKIPQILRTSLIYNLATITVVSIVFVVAREQISDLIGIPDLGPILAFGSLFIIFSTLSVFVTQIHQGFEEIRTASAFRILNKVSRLLIVVVFLVIGWGVFGALVGYIISFALVSVTGLSLLYHNKYRGAERSASDPSLNRSIFNYSIPIAFTQTAHVIDHHLDKVLLGFFAGPVAVGFYTVGKQVVQMAQTPTTALGFTLSPTYGAEKAKGNTETAARIFETALSRSLSIYIPAASGLVLVAEPTVELVFGSDYSGAAPVLKVFSIFIILQSVTKLTSHGLDYLGRARARAIVKAVSAILNVLLNVLLIPKYGATGAAIATVLTYSLYTLVNILIMHQELGLRIFYLLEQVGYTAVVTIIMSTVVLSLSGYISGFMSLFVVVFLGSCVWLLFSLLFGLIDLRNTIAFL